MTKKELEALVQLRQQLNVVQQLTQEWLKEEKFNTLDDLNKDLVATQASSVHVLAGILSIRIGLNISNVQAEASERPVEPNGDKDEELPS